MSYMALYRVWRPQSFQDVVGQKHIKQTLQNALSRQQFSHAYLFSGPRGTGKTSTAKILAKAINCQNGPSAEPCNQCEVCQQITEGSLMDVVEIDAASNRGVEEIREIREKIKYAPSGVRYKVYIIDEVHMLTPEAFNALLKTLEEPPAHAVFILATTEPHKLPATIISRCQRFDFRRIQAEDIVERLMTICDTKSISYEDRALQLMARIADGGLRDATSLLDQAMALGGERITEGDILAITGGVSQSLYAVLAKHIADQQVAETLQWVEQVLEQGKSPEKLIDDLIRFYRDLLLICTMPDSPLTKEMFWLENDFKQWVSEQSVSSFFHVIELLNKMQSEMKWSSHPRILLEVALIRLCQPEELKQSTTSSPSLDSEALLKRITDLEKQVLDWKKQGISSLTNEKRETPIIKPTNLKPKLGQKENYKTIEPFLKNVDQVHLKKIQSQWGQLLAMVKDKRITVHAWLVDGEPVASRPDSILVAFKNGMHRDTTEKQANRELIEQSLEAVFGRSYRLVTVMQGEWQQLQETSAVKEEDFKLVPESTDKEEPWVREAMDLFGPNLVEIKDE
jgi:DNA polymerase-3 subunit gamma/tau